MQEIAIALGSNLGDRIDNLRRARTLLVNWPGGRLTDSAPVYETAPLDVPTPFAHQWFLNTILLLDSAQSPDAILAVTQAIEQNLGRDRSQTPRNGPRPIDLDLIYAGDQVVRTPALKLPHPRWSQRAFVVRPLADLRPNRILPGQTRPVADLLPSLNHQTLRRYADCPWWQATDQPTLRNTE